LGDGRRLDVAAALGGPAPAVPIPAVTPGAGLFEPLAA